jgi:hypothetical protein
MRLLRYEQDFLPELVVQAAVELRSRRGRLLISVHEVSSLFLLALATGVCIQIAVRKSRAISEHFAYWNSFLAQWCGDEDPPR